MIFTFKENNTKHCCKLDNNTKIKLDFKTTHKSVYNGKEFLPFCGQDEIFNYLQKLYAGELENKYAKFEVSDQIIEAVAVEVNFGEEAYLIGPFETIMIITWKCKVVEV